MYMAGLVGIAPRTSSSRPRGVRRKGEPTRSLHELDLPKSVDPGSRLLR